MSTGTTLPLVKRTLRSNLGARAGLSGVQVSYERPTSSTLKDESIWFDEDTETDAEIPVMKSSTKTVEETYSFVVVVQVLIRDGRDAEAADTRAAELVAELQQELAEKPRPTNEILWLELAGWSHHVGTIGETTNRGSRFELAIRAHARLKP